MIKEIRRRVYKTSDGKVFIEKKDAEVHHEQLLAIAAKQKEELVYFSVVKHLNPKFNTSGEGFWVANGYKQAIRDVIKHFNLQPKEI